MLLPSSGRSATSETLVSYRNTEDVDLNLHRRENLKSHVEAVCAPVLLLLHLTVCFVSL
jgi:hypothetical protein